MNEKKFYNGKMYKRQILEIKIWFCEDLVEQEGTLGYALCLQMFSINFCFVKIILILINEVHNYYQVILFHIPLQNNKLKDETIED